MLPGFSTNILVRKFNDVLYNNQITNNLGINRTSALPLNRANSLSVMKTKPATLFREISVIYSYFENYAKQTNVVCGKLQTT